MNMAGLNYELLPEHIREAMRLYVEHGVLPGSFCQALICNDFIEVFKRGDYINLLNIQNIANFMYNEMSYRAWKSEAAMMKWNSHGGYMGLIGGQKCEEGQEKATL